VWDYISVYVHTFLGLVVEYEYDHDHSRVYIVVKLLRNMQINPNIRQQLKDLKKLRWGDVRRTSAVVVELPIGQLSPKDRGRALYVVGSAFTELTNKQKIISKIIHTVQDDFKKLIENKEITRDELIKEIKKIVLDPPELSSQNEDSSDDEDKE
jgi:hypothetical protein